jgi:2'-5' RNA ligase
VVPAVDAILDDLRAELPTGATVLDPAHISFGYPWLSPRRARDVIDDVAAALSNEPPFDVQLRGPRRFSPDSKGRTTVWLDPQPAAALRSLSSTIARASGHDLVDFTPHCSLVRVGPGVDPRPLEDIVQPHLPLVTRLERVDFHVRENGCWHVERTMTLGTDHQ